MFKFLNKRVGLQWFVFVALFATCLYFIIVKSFVPDDCGSHCLAFPFFQLLHDSPIFRIVVSILNLCLQLLLLDRFLSKSKINVKDSPYPGIFLLALLLATRTLTELSPIFFTNTLLIAILALNANTDNDFITKRNIFFTGILIALGCCFDYAFIITLLFFIVSLIVNLYSKIRHIMILLSGFLILTCYVFCFYLFTDTLFVLTENISTYSALTLFESHTHYPPVRIVFFSLAFLFSWIMLANISRVFESKVVEMRKRLITLQILYVIQFFALLLCTVDYPFYLQYLIVPLSCFFVSFAQTPNRFFINELIVLIIFLGLCL